jgi:adenine-specific DNA methylase
MNDEPATKSDKRLIERWLPIAFLGEESVRERRFSMAGNALPPNNSLHVWWARRPLVASRAAILASILPAEANHDQFTHALGILGDPIKAKHSIERARRTGERIVDPYYWPRAFRHNLTDEDRRWISMLIGNDQPVVLDPTAGGGSIPFEATRLGLKTFANDLNPVAALIMRATVEWPLRYGHAVQIAFERLAKSFRGRLEGRLSDLYPQRNAPNQYDITYLWARTIRCPYCEGLVPLSPNWQFAPGGTGARMRPHLGNGPGDGTRTCEFEIVTRTADHSSGTVADGDGTCPFSDCGRVIDGDDIKRQAKAGCMGEQLVAIAFKRRIETKTKAGKRGRDKWERGYRAPTPEDNNSAEIAARLTEKMEEWSTLDFVPNEAIGDLSNYDRGHRMYGLDRWVDMFSPRQLLGHGTSVEVFRELLSEHEVAGTLDDVTKAAFAYLGISLDKMLDYNSRMTRWHSKREVIVNTFDSHNFAHRWSFTEMAPLISGLGYDWALEQVKNCIEGLVGLSRPDTQEEDTLIRRNSAITPPPIIISCGSTDSVDHISAASVDVIVIDPPYYDNVMYAELSDFFYVWLKRTVGQVVPELFTRRLTDKDAEAVANAAKFADQKGAKALAGRDYQERMARIFEECRRVLRITGVMTLMFTHKATGAWDALTKGLMQAGFTITASWPINTEAEGSLHIKDKSAANSTILLVCRPRLGPVSTVSHDYWEDVEPLVAQAVRTRVAEFQQAGIGGVDLYLACFGPALEEFSRHWPLKRGTPRAKPEALKRRRQAEMFEDEWDPYAVTPEDALDAARREVKRWRLEQLTHMKASDELDPLTSFFVLAWDAFRAPVFPYDEALRLGRAVGVDLDKQVVGVLVEKKGSDLVMWDSARRAAKGALGPADGSRGMIDAIHHAAHFGRTRTLQVAREMLAKVGVDKEQMFFAALEAVLEVLPVGKAFSGIDLEGDLGAAGSDFEALENLRKLAFSEQVDAPKQLELWAEPLAA